MTTVIIYHAKITVGRKMKMAELPEIYKIANQMNDTIKGKSIIGMELVQEKCANISIEDFEKRICNASIIKVTYKGKWILISLSNKEYILISLGMGGDLLYYDTNKNIQEKYQVKLIFNDDSGFTIRFWWFGKFYLVHEEELSSEKSTKDIAMDPYDEQFTYAYFRNLFNGKKSKIKSFLLTQSNIGGIGNMYMHDILYKSSLHPDKKISEMTELDFQNLYQSILEILKFSSSKGAFAYEYDFLGEKGNFTTDDFLVGYKEGQKCPKCETQIEQIKTGSTSSFICSNCQKL
jgi:formamidopyrimidine-DNA glycosylase